MYNDLLKALRARSDRQVPGSNLYRAAAEAIEELMEERVKLLREIHGYCKFCKRNNDGEVRVVNRIAELRKKSNLSQTKLAERLDIAQNTLSQYENELRTPPNRIVLYLADLFDVTPNYLMGVAGRKGDLNMKWISTEDSLPECGERVMATDGTFVGEAYRTSANSWYRHTGFPWRNLGAVVTHWMPLPEPPKEG